MQTTEGNLTDTGHLKKNRLGTTVESALQRQESGEWRQADEAGRKWKVHCTLCGRTTFVSNVIR
ncbi:MAG: hypothetical protein KA314_24045 [Chloroflexi bacterium]|nr:hypothetical protein [Chloroflexota bacterium]MBP8058916.1 hypothetical protein [Chloroflexota bacterium]